MNLFYHRLSFTSIPFPESSILVLKSKNKFVMMIKRGEPMKKFNSLNNIIIPIFIVAVCSLAPILHQNLTYIANQLPYRFLVFILALLIAYNFYTQFSCLFKVTGFYGQKVASLMIFSLLLIPLAVLVPYNKKDILTSTIHVWISFGGSILFMILLNVFLWHLAKTQLAIYQQILPVYLFLITGCFTLFVWLGSVSSLVEIFFIWILDALIYRLNLLFKL